MTGSIPVVGSDQKSKKLDGEKFHFCVYKYVHLKQCDPVYFDFRFIRSVGREVSSTNI